MPAPLDLFHRKAVGKKGSQKALNKAGAKNEANTEQLTALFLLGLLGGTFVSNCAKPTPAASNSGGASFSRFIAEQWNGTESSFLPSDDGKLHSDASKVLLRGGACPHFIRIWPHLMGLDFLTN